MISPADVTIIIPHLGKTESQRYSLNHCINSLIETAPTIKRLVSFNGSPEDLGESFFLHPLTDYDFLMLADQGQCKAVNAAVAMTNTPWIMISNDDMVYPSGWFENLTSNIDYNGYFCVSPKLIEPNPGAPTFETYFCGGAGGDFDREKFFAFAKNYELRSDEEKKVRTGFNLPFLISRDLWNLVGGYDINYDPWGSNSDSDLEYKIKLAGIQPMQNQRSIVYHFSQTSGTFEPKNQKYWGKNWEYFINKWGFPRTDQGIWEANFKIPTPEEGRIFEPWWEDFFKEENNMMSIQNKV